MAIISWHTNKKLAALSVAALLAVSIFWGCAGVVQPPPDGSSPSDATVSSIIVSPNPAALAASGTLQFAAAVQGTAANKSVTWKASAGSITSSGLYTAPSNPGTVAVTATSNADRTKATSATVTVTQAAASPVVTSVTISPTVASSVTGGTLPFTATVQGTTSNKTVTWKASLGTISASGLYTAPPTAGTATVTAASNADSTKWASATVAVTAATSPTPPEPPSQAPVISSLSATPPTVQDGQSSMLQWSVTGATSLDLSGVGAVSRTSLNITPSQTTTYTLVAANAAGSASQSVTVTVTAQSVAQQSFEMGVNTHFGQDKGNVQANLNLIQQMGATTIRDEVYWKEVEQVKGQYAIPSISETFVNAAVAKGLKPLITLDYGNPLYDNGDKPTTEDAIEGYAQYAEFVATQFKGRVSMYEIWNEWDLSTGNTTPGTPQSYVNLLKVVYPRLKAIDPNIVVLGGGVSGGAILSSFFGQMLDAGAMNSADAISIHQYIYTATGNGRTPETLVNNLLGAEETLRSHNGGQDYPLYLTETGWPTNTGASGTTPDEAGDFNAETMLLLPTMPFLKGLWWYDFQDDGTVTTYTEDNFGLVYANLTPKPGFYALAAVTRWMAGAQFSARLKTSDPAVDGVEFLLPSGQQAMALWRQGTGTGSVQIKGASTMQLINNVSLNTISSQTTSPLVQDLTESPMWFTGESLELQ